MTEPPVDLGLGGPSLDEDEKALKKGNTGVLIGAAVAALALVVGLLAVFLSMDDGSEYAAVGRRINQMKADNFDRFLSCSFEQTRPRDIRTNADLVHAIHRHARSGPGPVAYAAHVRQDCMVRLNEHGPGLRELIPPQDLEEELAALSDALQAFRDGWIAYLTHLDRFEENYNNDDYDDEVDAITRAWFDYKTAHGNLNDLIRPHVN